MSSSSLLFFTSVSILMVMCLLSSCILFSHAACSLCIYTLHTSLTLFTFAFYIRRCMLDHSVHCYVMAWFGFRFAMFSSSMLSLALGLVIMPCHALLCMLVTLRLYLGFVPNGVFHAKPLRLVMLYLINSKFVTPKAGTLFMRDL